jgi:hypothetical protein
MAAKIRYHEGDISAADAARYTGAIAIDTETLGLVPRRDRLCVVQLSPGDGSADVIRIAAGQKEAPNLVAMLADASRQKIFHYGRFDIAVLFHAFGVTTQSIFCTKIASRLCRTYTDRHGLKDNLKEMLEVDFQGAAVVRLGGSEAVAGAARICGFRRALPACPARQADRTPRARRPYGACECLLRIPADPRQARPARLGRDRHFRPQLSNCQLASAPDRARLCDAPKH